MYSVPGSVLESICCMISQVHNDPMRCIAFYPCFSSEETDSQENPRGCFLLRYTQVKVVSSFSLISHCLFTSCCWKSSVLCPLRTPEPGHLCFVIQVSKCDYSGEDILTIANSPFLSIYRINKTGVSKEKLDRKTFVFQSISWSKLHNLSPGFLKYKKEGYYRLHSIVITIKWDHI